MRTGAVIALVLLAAVLIGGTAAESAIVGLSEQYVSAAEEVRILTTDGAWQRAGDALAAYQHRWDQARRWLELLIQQSGIDEITLALDRLNVAIRRQDASLCDVTCTELRQYAESLRLRETLSLNSLL